MAQSASPSPLPDDVKSKIKALSTSSVKQKHTVESWLQHLPDDPQEEGAEELLTSATIRKLMEEDDATVLEPLDSASQIGSLGKKTEAMILSHLRRQLNDKNEKNTGKVVPDDVINFLAETLSPSQKKRRDARALDPNFKTYAGRKKARNVSFTVPSPIDTNKQVNSPVKVGYRSLTRPSLNSHASSPTTKIQKTALQSPQSPASTIFESISSPQSDHSFNKSSNESGRRLIIAERETEAIEKSLPKNARSPSCKSTTSSYHSAINNNNKATSPRQCPAKIIGGNSSVVTGLTKNTLKLVPNSESSKAKPSTVSTATQTSLTKQPDNNDIPQRTLHLINGPPLSVLSTLAFSENTQDSEDVEISTLIEKSMHEERLLEQTEQQTSEAVSHNANEANPMTSQKHIRFIFPRSNIKQFIKRYCPNPTLSRNRHFVDMAEAASAFYLHTLLEKANEIAAKNGRDYINTNDVAALYELEYGQKLSKTAKKQIIATMMDILQ